MASSSSMMMAFLSSQLFFTALAFTISLFILVLFSNKKSNNGVMKKLKKQLRLPPGPPGWPIVGNLFQVAMSGKSIIHYILDARDAYGPIFTLRMGTRTLIVITSPELAHEVLIQRGQAFANRPAENPTRTIFSCDKLTVNSALYGPEWRSLRRNMVQGMLSPARLREFLPIRRSSMDRFIHRIRNEAITTGGEVWVLRNARFAVFCILLCMCFGLDLDEETIVRIDKVMQTVLITLNPRMDDYLPLLGPFFSKQRKQALQVRRLQIDTLVPLIEMRRTILKDPAAHPGAAPFSYLDSLLDLKVERSSSVPTEEELVTLCSEFINGGTDTTATAIEWGIARIIDNPAIQSRIYDEIEAVIPDGSRAVDEGDTDKMPYLQAFVKELLRKHPPTYFSLTHAAVETAELGGYDIPADANLEIYLPTIAEDSRLWKEPFKFDPERFLGGGEGADMTGVTGVRMIPFGAGRRVCPGLGMGMTHVSLMIARMVQEFEWRVHPSQEPIDFADKLVFTVVMKTPLLAVVKPRKKEM